MAWLVPMNAAERRRAELLAAGRLRPAAAPDVLLRWQPLLARPDGASLRDAPVEMREAEGR
ncbi:hypothetical protein ACFPK5_24810 [Streptomyces beijiangensis]|uniref:hypothetical protein n=1 Tax=Streptomyces beijiangensis TaxID=163361 RepID=UPI003622F9DD